MRTRLQCLANADHCARFVQLTDTPANEYLLLEMARQWRCLADAARPAVYELEPNSGKLAARNEVLTAWLLSQSGALIR
jgi:hypothetical protein